MNKPMVYDGQLIGDRFAHLYLKDKLMRSGNILSFVSPISFPVTQSYSGEQISQAINFAIELYDVSVYAGTCFKRLFIMAISGLLSDRLNCPVEIRGNDIIIKKEHTLNLLVQPDGIANIVQANKVSDAFMIYIGLYNKIDESKDSSNNRAFALNFTAQEIEFFVKDVEKMFYDLSIGLFLDTCKL